METATSPYGRCRAQVEAMIMDGEPLAEIDELLEESPLPSDERDALWLLAWSLEQRLDDRDRAVLEGPQWTGPPALFAVPREG